MRLQNHCVAGGENHENRLKIAIIGRGDTRAKVLVFYDNGREPATAPTVKRVNKSAAGLDQGTKARASA